MKAAKVLTDTAIKAAKSEDKPYKLYDMRRLYLLVSVAGSKCWKWNYRLDGKDCTFTIGEYPGVGLAKARSIRDEAKKLVDQGIHPLDHKRTLRLRQKNEAATTFWGVAKEWIEIKTPSWSPYYAKQVESFMGRYVGDADIGQRSIGSIDARDIYGLVRGVAQRTSKSKDERKSSGAPTLAINLRQWCSAVFRHAIVSGRAKTNPVADLKAGDVIVRPPVKNNRALSPAEISNLLAALCRYRGTRSTRIAVELLLLTFVRTGELRMATWGEFDLKKAIWTIPARRMKIKANGDHVVPLSRQAALLLEELREVNSYPANDRNQLLFPNRVKLDTCISATTINRALEYMKLNGKGTIGFSAHGFRGTASTLLHEMGFRPEVIEVQLAHKESNSVKAAYNKALYLNDRVSMMQKWADYIDTLRVLHVIEPSVMASEHKGTP